MAIALVSIGRAFGVGAADTAWLVSSAYVASAVGQPTMGRLVDRFGAKGVYFAGLGLVTLGALVGVLASSFWLLIVARVILGFGTAAAYPSALALVRREAERTGQAVPGAVLGALSVASQVSMGLGPLIGGLALGAAGWRGIFLVNFPLVALAATFAILWFPKDAQTRRVPSLRGLDVIGAGLFVAGLSLALLVLLGNVSVLVLLGAAAAVAAFVAWELRAEEPFIDLRLLSRSPALCLTYLRNGGGFLVIYAFTYGWSQWLEAGGYSPAQVGVFLAPTFLVAATASVFLSRRRLVLAPLALGGVALVGLSAGILLLDHDASPVAFFLLSGVAGIATGALAIGNQAALYAQSPTQTIGVAAGLLRTSMNLGAILAASLIGAVYGEAASDAGLHTLGLALLAVSVAVAAMTAFDPRLRGANGP